MKVRQMYPVIMKWLWVVPFIFGLLIAVFSPLDILKYDIAQFIVSVMGFFAPMIDKVKGQYEMSQVVQFYFSVMWLMSPLMYFSFLEGGNYDGEKLVSNFKKHKILLPMVTVSVSLAVIWFGIFIGPDTANLHDVRTNMTLHTRLGLASYGFLIPSGTAAFLAILVMLKRHFGEIYSN